MKAIVVLLALTGGCSLVATRSAPRGPARTCGSYIAPIVDAALTAAVLVLAYDSYSKYNCSGRLDGCHTFDPTPLYVVPALPLVISTAWGFTAEPRCRAMQGAGG